MGIGDFFKKLFGGAAKVDPQAALKNQLEKSGTISGVDNITSADGSPVSIKVIGDDTPDDWGGWDPKDFEAFHQRSEEIRQAEDAGEAELAQVLAKYGLRDWDHFDRVSDTFLKHHSDNPAFNQAAVNVAMAKSKQMMQNAVSPEQLAPIEGVSLEVYATVMARKTQMTDAAQVHPLLAEYGLDEAKFDRVDQAWQARMRQAEDPMAAAAIATEYGKHFAAAGQGQYGGAAQAAAGGIGIAGAVGQAPAGNEPCSLERYAEIMAAQSVWAQQGRDVNQMLQQQFQITAVDWSNMSAFWSQKFTSDYTLMQKMSDLQQQYEARYSSGGGADDDINF